MNKTLSLNELFEQVEKESEEQYKNDLASGKINFESEERKERFEKEMQRLKANGCIEECDSQEDEDEEE